MSTFILFYFASHGRKRQGWESQRGRCQLPERAARKLGLQGRDRHDHNLHAADSHKRQQDCPEWSCRGDQWYTINKVNDQLSKSISFADRRTWIEKWIEEWSKPESELEPAIQFRSSEVKHTSWPRWADVYLLREAIHERQSSENSAMRWQVLWDMRVNRSGESQIRPEVKSCVR